MGYKTETRKRKRHTYNAGINWLREIMTTILKEAKLLSNKKREAIATVAVL
jgi:hypothetical protein